MIALDFNDIAAQCVQQIDPQIMKAVVRVESGFNPYAIGVVNGRLTRQPKTHNEAVATAKYLEQNGYNFSMGLGQVNKKNLNAYKLDFQSVFEPCKNLKASSEILAECYGRATKIMSTDKALQAAFSCYYSGNFTRGFRPDFKGQPSYVSKILASAQMTQAKPILVVPNIPSNHLIKQNNKLDKPERKINDAINMTQKLDSTREVQQEERNNYPEWDVFKNFNS
jgi:type IV secretion system protein VirB1